MSYNKFVTDLDIQFVQRGKLFRSRRVEDFKLGMVKLARAKVHGATRKYTKHPT